MHTNLTTTNLSGDTGYVSHHGHSQQSSAGSVGSSGPCNSPGSPGVRYKEENIRNSTSEGEISFFVVKNSHDGNIFFVVMMEEFFFFSR